MWTLSRPCQTIQSSLADETQTPSIGPKAHHAMWSLLAQTSLMDPSIQLDSDPVVEAGPPAHVSIDGDVMFRAKRLNSTGHAMEVARKSIHSVPNTRDEAVTLRSSRGGLTIW